MLGTVLSVERETIQVQLGGRSADRLYIVPVPVNGYQAIDHCYATAIHKNQGATVDRAFVWASGTMDRQLTYVVMTRHRDGVVLYAAQDEFTSRQAGKLVDHGGAPYEQKDSSRDSYFVTLENASGEHSTT
jgi:ATP-dependent exoDNAse (exonuclease V) alpha subunit